MQILETILYILLFILCLSVLIVIHELGHFTAAKAFNVYCNEFSIGFGPAIFKKRKPGKETQFSIRAIPFGGYVSMFGEGSEKEFAEAVGVESIDPNRSLRAIKKWKRAIVLFAGVFMNAVLAIVLFLVSNSLPQKQLYFNMVTGVSDNSPAALAGLKQDEIINVNTLDSSLYVLDNEALLTYSDTSKEPQNIYAIVDTTNMTYKSERNLDNYVRYFAQVSETLQPDYDQVGYLLSYKLSINNGDSFTYAKLDNNGGVISLKATSKYYEAASFNFVPTIVGEETLYYLNVSDETLNYVVSISDTGVISFSNAPSSYWKVMKNNDNKALLVSNNYSFNLNADTFETKEVESNQEACLSTRNVDTSREINSEGVKSLNISFFGREDKVDGTKKYNHHSMSVNVVNDGTTHFESFGISYYLGEYRQSFGDVIKNTFVDFGNSATVIVRSLGMLFTSKEALSQTSGIIGIGVTTTSVLQNFGIAQFIYIWGLISVNLAIMNLIPFPGLDGWQLLVLLVEAVAHKEIPAKVKSIVSFVGIAILMVLMVILLFKDAFTFIF